MAYKWLLLDFDNTLVDSDEATRSAFFDILSDYKFVVDESCYLVYKRINKGLWSDFEDGIITAQDLRFRRFNDFFEYKGWDTGICGDLSVHYLDYLVKYTELQEGYLDCLQRLSRKYEMKIITNGFKDVQYRRLEKVDILGLFKSVVVADVVGVAKPNSAYFEYTYQLMPEKPQKSEVLVVGDNLKSDVLGAKKYGFHTCWIKRGSNKLITPGYANHEYNCLLELEENVLS